MLTEENRTDIVRYRINNAQRTLKEVDILIENGLYNTAASRLYYSCYYAATALLVANHVTTKTHEGVRQMFSAKFVKTGIFPPYFGRMYSELFNARLTGDYEDLFNHNADTIALLIPKATEFVNAVCNEALKWIDTQNTQ